MVRCVEDTARALACRDSQAAAHLKLISIWVIFFTSVVGISSPVMLARYFQGKPLYDKAVLVIKCFAAGVIMSTSLVHVLPDAFDALSDCRVASRHPWKDFPFSGLVTMVGALLALLVDITASSHVEHSQQNPRDHYAPVPALTQEELMETKKPYESRCEAGELEPSHELMETKKPYESRCEAGELEPSHELMETKKPCESRCEAGEVGPSHEQRVEELVRLKQRLVSQVLEIGIIFHSVIIGVTMGMSQNQCTIRPLVAALAFHQIFEGMGLGGCIAQAGFGFGTTAYMCFMFSVTTPVGIVMGMILFSATGYDDSNPNALIMEGLLGSFSSGILIYMALVDLIAVDFFHNKMMNSSPWMKKTSYIALTLGSTAMSILAIWA